MQGWMKEYDGEDGEREDTDDERYCGGHDQRESESSVRHGGRRCHRIEEF